MSQFSFIKLRCGLHIWNVSVNMFILKKKNRNYVILI